MPDTATRDKQDTPRRPAAICWICHGHGGGLVLTFGKWMCRDRVDCYQRFKKLT